MNEVEQIDQQIERLDDQAFVRLRQRLRQWFIEYDHARWDRQIDADFGVREAHFLAPRE